MIKLVAFDWNGTLFADTISCLEGDNAVLATLGIKPLTIKQFRDKFDVPIVNFYKNAGVEPKKALANYMQNEALFHSVYEKRAEKSRSRAHTGELLTWLKEHKIDSIIISNHTVQGIGKHLKRLRIEAYFRDVLANDSIGLIFKNRSKKEKLQAYLAQNGIKPKDILIVGDATEEIEIARAIGTKVIAITNGFYSTPRLRKAKPDYLIHDLKEVIGIIENLNSPNP